MDKDRIAGSAKVVKGKVKEEGGKTLEEVLVQAINVRNKEDKHQVKSDSKGDFEFSGLPAGDYSFSLEKQGYKTVTKKLSLPKSKNSYETEQTIKMRKGTP